MSCRVARRASNEIAIENKKKLSAKKVAKNPKKEEKEVLNADEAVSPLTHTPRKTQGTMPWTRLIWKSSLAQQEKTLKRAKRAKRKEMASNLNDLL